VAPNVWARFRKHLLAVEPPSERSTQRGLAWWQPSEPQDKNHRVNLIHPVGLQSLYTSLHLLINLYIVLVLLLL
jgi:hypothetical protein